MKIWIYKKKTSRERKAYTLAPGIYEIRDIKKNAILYNNHYCERKGCY